MPVFVEWKWIERTKTLLTIFHFYDDFSKRNLRLMKFGDTPLFSTEGGLKVKKDWISWAPSHPEMALLMQLLSYANIINGLKPSDKKRLWFELEGREKDRGFYEDLPKTVTPQAVSEKIGRDKKVVFYTEPRAEKRGFLPIHTCVELSAEYIDFLRRKLNPYLMD